MAQNTNSKTAEYIAMEDKNSAVLLIGQMLWKKAEKNTDFESLNSYERNVIMLDMLEGQVLNGGLDQFFFNSSGDYAYQIQSALQEVNSVEKLRILKEAISIFPANPIPSSIEKRRLLMDDLSEEVTNKWEELDDQYYGGSENLSELVFDYVKRNLEHFD